MTARMKQKARTPQREKVVQELRRVRIERFGTLRQASKKSDLSPTVIHRLETNKTKPNATTLRKYAEMTGWPIRRLMAHYWPEA
jgi:DNA-binding XRE family transcriptional regulator